MNLLMESACDNAVTRGPSATFKVSKKSFMVLEHFPFGETFLVDLLIC